MWSSLKAVMLWEGLLENKKLERLSNVYIDILLLCQVRNKEEIAVGNGREIELMNFLAT